MGEEISYYNHSIEITLPHQICMQKECDQYNRHKYMEVQNTRSVRKNEFHQIYYTEQEYRQIALT